jgi:solute carrier family 25 oxoglutarate transporter 11
MSDFKQSPTYKAIAPFLRGGLSGMFATTCIQPIDMVKVRIQVQEGANINRNPFSIGAQMIRNEGLLSMYKGLSAGLLRQATYTTARMGLFNKFSEMIKDEKGQTTFAKRAGAGLAAGGLGSVIGNPCDLALIRMQADATLPAAQRRGYKNVFDALLYVIVNGS